MTWCVVINNKVITNNKQDNEGTMINDARHMKSKYQMKQLFFFLK